LVHGPIYPNRLVRKNCRKFSKRQYPV